jgi:hypothetical protein
MIRYLLFGNILIVFFNGALTHAVRSVGNKVMNEWMEYGAFWNVPEGGRRKYSENNLSQCQLVHYISHTEWLGIVSGPLRWVDGCKPPKHELLGCPDQTRIQNVLQFL